MLGQFVAAPVEPISVAGKRADDREQDRRAARPEGGIAVPEQVAPLRVGDALQFGAECRDLDRQSVRGDAEGRVGIGSVAGRSVVLRLVLAARALQCRRRRRAVERRARGMMSGFLPWISARCARPGRPAGSRRVEWWPCVISSQWVEAGNA
jgi:hypothetical protein